MENIKSTEIINSFNYAVNCDVVYSGLFTQNQIDKLGKESFHISDYNKDYLKIRNQSFLLKENDLVFTSLEFIDELFHLLSPIKNLKNIKVLTHQSDRSITKEMFDTKPKCISTWFGINVDYENKNLIPIPIGLSNNHPKNVNFEHLNQQLNPETEKLLYLNFNIQTNAKHRQNLYEKFEIYDWVTVEKANLTIESYAENLSAHKYSLCPWGNGLDTHRFWESIYLGTIPITQKKLTYKYADGLPHLLVDKYEDIDINFLTKNNLSTKENFKYEKLRVGYWINLMDKKIDSKETYYVTSSGITILYLDKKYHLKNSFHSKYKIASYYLKKIISKLRNIF